MPQVNMIAIMLRTVTMSYTASPVIGLRPMFASVAPRVNYFSVFAPATNRLTVAR